MVLSSNIVVLLGSPLREGSSMACIKVQKLVSNPDGSIHSGSASIIDTVYDTNIKGNSRKKTREKLGKVIYINDKHTCGIFLSPTRGLIQYDSKEDRFSDVERDDPRIKDPDLFPEPPVHTEFGDSYLIFCFLKKCGLIDVLRAAFTSDVDYEKVLCHLIHGICRNKSHISCDDYFRKSFASYVLTDIPIEKLGSDSAYYQRMGDDNLKVAFFTNFVNYMRKSDPGFGIGCYVDSTPLPNDIRDNPFNALCSHGVTSTSIQTRLILVLDENTGIPVWFQVIPGNLLDLSTIMNVISDVAETLDVRIDSLVLDAGYVSKPLLQMFNLNSEMAEDINGRKKRRVMLARMPAKKGYPYKQLYNEVKRLIPNSKYQFDRHGHTYFGYCKAVRIFDCNELAYVYVDKDNALELARSNRLKDPQAYEKLSMAEKNWFDVKYGYFVLISNEEKSPSEILDDYFDRADIETAFKTSKAYLDILPLEKWTETRVLGKLFSDMIEEIVYLFLLKALTGEGIATTRLLGATSSLMCLKKRSGDIEVEVPNKIVRLFYKKMGVEIPSSFNLKEFCKNTLLLVK